MNPMWDASLQNAISLCSREGHKGDSDTLWELRNALLAQQATGHEKRISVDAEALKQVLQALVGPGHHIRELQATRSLHKLGHPNPIERLVADYEVATAFVGVAPSPAPAVADEAVATVVDMKYNTVKFVRKNAQGDSLPYLQPGTKLYAASPAPASEVVDRLLHEWMEASGRTWLTGAESEDLRQLIRAALQSVKPAPAPESGSSAPVVASGLERGGSLGMVETHPNYVAGFKAGATTGRRRGATAALTALQNLLAYTENKQCTHESVHRGGTIWTICDSCGQKWSDEEGGFKPYLEPVELMNARDVLARSDIPGPDAVGLADQLEALLAKLMPEHSRGQPEVAYLMSRLRFSLKGVKASDPHSLDRERLVWAMANLCTHQMATAWVSHVLRVGGTGDYDDCVAFIDEQMRKPPMATPD